VRRLFWDEVLIWGDLGGGHQPFKKGVEAWVNEKPNYHGEKIAEGDFKGYGHYTQVCFILGGFFPWGDEECDGERALMGNRLSGLLLRMLGWLLRRGRMGIRLLWEGIRRRGISVGRLPLRGKSEQ